MKQVAERWKNMCKVERAKWCFDPPVPKVRKKRSAAASRTAPQLPGGCAQTAPAKSSISKDAGLQESVDGMDGAAVGGQPSNGLGNPITLGMDSLMSRPAKVPRSLPPSLPSLPELVSRQAFLTGFHMPSGVAKTGGNAAPDNV
jgi:hypothetical protein